MDKELAEKIKTSMSLSDEQLDELWDAFLLFDKNGDGAISHLEITQVMRSLGKILATVHFQHVHTFFFIFTFLHYFDYYFLFVNILPPHYIMQ